MLLSLTKTGEGGSLGFLPQSVKVLWGGFSLFNGFLKADLS